MRASRAGIASSRSHRRWRWSPTSIASPSARLLPDIRRDLGLTAVQMGWVFTVFQFAHGLFEVPTGRWADRVGTRSVMARIVIWWSALTAATAAAFNYPVMLVVRFLFDVGEASAWPCVARTFSSGFRAASADARRAFSSLARTWSPD